MPQQTARTREGGITLVVTALAGTIDPEEVKQLVARGAKSVTFRPAAGNCHEQVLVAGKAEAEMLFEGDCKAWFFEVSSVMAGKLERCLGSNYKVVRI